MPDPCDYNGTMNQQGRVYDPALDACLGCGAYRDPYAEQCPCGRMLRRLPVLPPATRQAKSANLVRVLPIILGIALYLLTRVTVLGGY